MHSSLRNNDSDAKRIVMAMVLLLAGIAFASAASYWGWRWWRRTHPRPLISVVTVAGSGPEITTLGKPASGRLTDPFGVAADSHGVIFVTDGAGGAVFRFQDGTLTRVATGLTMPSAVAVAPDGGLIVANTGSHTIVRVDANNGSSMVIAGATGIAGDNDGLGKEARFHAPVGLTVSRDGTIFVADTYNDRIRVVESSGRVSTLAGSTPGFRDASGNEALFYAPCGITEDPEGALIVADTGNHRLRKVARNGTVTTLAGAGDGAQRDGTFGEAAFNQPIALGWRDAKSLFVADSGSGTLRLCAFGDEPRVSTIAGAGPASDSSGDALHGRLGRPTGLAFADPEELFFADGAQGLLRALAAAGTSLSNEAQPESKRIPPAEIRAAVPPRWPFDPPLSPREIAGTFGEVRGEVMPEHDAWFHNGLDVPGHYGEIARAIFSERVTLPLSVEGFGGPRERVRLPLIGYIHLRLGRDANDKPFGDSRFLFHRDEQGQLDNLRIPRGSLFNAGDGLGTLNRLNHVHLIAGPYNGEVNALAALELPGFIDTLAPVIEDVRLETAEGQTIERSREKQREWQVSGRIRVVVRAYDRVDGMAAYRRLGPYRLGYQVRRADGSPTPGYKDAEASLNFDRLPSDPGAVRLVYAVGSESGYEGKTIFDYIVTNTLRDGRANEGYWDTSQLPAGRYTLRVFVEDFARNRAMRDIPVEVVTAVH